MAESPGATARSRADLTHFTGTPARKWRRVVNVTAGDQNGFYTLTYDAVDRVTVVQELFGQRLTFSYDAVGNRTGVQDSSNGVTTSTGLSVSQPVTIRAKGIF